MGTKQGMAVHKSERHPRCTQCDFAARNPSHLNQHIKQKHEGVTKRRYIPKKKSLITEKDIGEVTEVDLAADGSPFVPMICEALAQAEGNALSTDDICAFISRQNPQYNMNMIAWQNSVKLRLDRSPKFVKIRGRGVGGHPGRGHMYRMK